MAGIDVASGTVVLAVGPALTGLWRVGLVILSQWFSGSLVRWFNGSSGKRSEAERGFGRYAPYRCLITTNASDEPRGSNASMATQTQHVLRIDAKRDYACSDNSMTLNNNANDCKPCITQAPLRSAVLLTAPHRLEEAVSRLS